MRPPIADRGALTSAYALLILILPTYILSTPTQQVAINSYPLEINFEPAGKTSVRPRSKFSDSLVGRKVSEADKITFERQLRQYEERLSRSYGDDLADLLELGPPLPSILPESTETGFSSQQSASSHQKRTLGLIAQPIPLADSDYPTTTGRSLSAGDEQDNEPSKINLTETNARLVQLRRKMIALQGKANVSIEDTNWKIAASCLSAQFGPQFIRNKDVKCASSQVVLSISRMQRAGCKSCEPYFHCEGFSNAISRCKNNYDVEDTLKVIRECKGLTDEDADSIEATRAPSMNIDCQKAYLCGMDCNYNPSEGTCPKNNCQQQQIFKERNIQAYKSHLNRRPKETNLAYPADSPVKALTLGAGSNRNVSST